jgi:hypothetical protein
MRASIASLLLAGALLGDDTSVADVGPSPDAACKMSLRLAA